MTNTPITQILTDAQVKQIMKRLAYQVFEQHSEVKDLIVASINGNGTFVARMLAEQLSEISSIRIKEAQILLNKELPEDAEIRIEPAGLNPAGKYVVVVDDVLNSGRTLIHAINPFISKGCKRLQTLVLVDRNHRSFPVSADYKGISLATTLQEHVEVRIEKKKTNVYLR